MTNETTILQKLSVPFEFPVVFTHHVFAPENPVLRDTMNRLGENRRHRAMVYVDSNVAAADPGLTGRIIAYFRSHAGEIELVGEPEIVPGGEQIKNDLAGVKKMAAAMLDHRMDRHAFIIAVGGGAVLDAVGFAASLVHRGLRIIRVPTTVLSQNDGGVGVKTGINFPGGKNAIGTFCPPFAVLDDFQFLLTLPDREWRDGVAEAFKVSIIRDRAFFDELCRNAPRFRARDFEAMERLVVRCAGLHLEHIRTAGDPFELGRARPLDFGHWSAHKLELMSDFSISHGEAVAVGMLLDCEYAVRKGWLTPDEFARVHTGLAKSGLPVWVDELERTRDGVLEIFDGLREFQEHLGGELCVTYPRGIGARHEVHEVDLALMQEAIAKLKSMAAKE
jgi:3-dehydroquinate synthase